MPLWSERQGHRRGLSKVDFRNALFEILEQLHEQRLFFEAWGDGYMGWGGYIPDPGRWVRDNLRDASLWEFLARPWVVYQEWDADTADLPKPKQWSFGVLFDIIELLHRDAVSVSGDGPGEHDQDAGRRTFRDAVNPILAQLEPPKVLTEDGEIADIADITKESIDEAIIRRGGPDGDTPALSEDVYGHIIEIIARVGRGMEISPGTHVKLGEEGRRDIYLVTLNTHYQDQAAGEAFNFTGKTDLRVRHQGDNVFIGECKIWDGAKVFTDALDQLLGYAAWRDTKLALIVFVPNKKLSDVIDLAKKLVEGHPQFIEWIREPTGEHPMRARFHWHGDEDQHAELAVFLVHLPVE